jgi:carbamoyl-phosphate synthase/aspartate carbamoyltransferase/dihydroorotase
VSTFRLPGLIDIHVHLRDPGQTHKEDFISGTSAALAGGFTTVFDMPNNAEPIMSVDKLKEKLALAKTKAVSDIGFYYGTLGDNLDTFEEAAQYAVGLKVYLNHTTGDFIMDANRLRDIYEAWPKDKPVLLHAEEDVIGTAMESLEGLNRHVHICHLPSRMVLEAVMKMKAAGYPVTCGVCPHHLFLTEEDAERLGGYGMMKPPLKTKADQAFLWEHLDDIDLFESDHAPHTRVEKEAGMFGVPGLETTLPLLLQAEQEGKITRQQIINKLFTVPSQLFGILQGDDTYIEVEEAEFEITDENLQTKCGWTPYKGMTGYGKVAKVVIRGTTHYENGTVVASPGAGHVIGGEE